jgi:AAA domain-containing protein
VRVITADERIIERKGVKLLLVGPVGVGKTYSLRSLPLDLTLFVDIEAGDLALAGVAVDTLRPRTWSECQDLACALGGPNPAVVLNAVYSQAHYDAVAGEFSDLSKYNMLFVDSITAASRLSFLHAEQQPEAFTERGKKDLRGVYGLHGRQMIGWLQQLQHARATAVIFVAILEKITDDFGRTSWGIQLEGQRTARELPGIIDVIVTMQWVTFDNTEPVRAFVCTNPNPWQWPAKHRSGRLEQIEEPDLGKLISKLTALRADLETQAKNERK